MRFLIAIAAIFAVFFNIVAAQGGACFDNFDCIGKGGNCVKPKGKLLGKCAPKDTATPTDGGEPVPTATAAPGGGSGVCFDNFDCIGKGGKCQREKGKILGKCVPK